ncbi:MAG TPA: hypothetical protein VF792_00905 [Ktedonobacterales bacterium]
MSHDEKRGASVAAFLRELAQQAESDSAFATHLRTALTKSGLLEAGADTSRPLASAKPRARTARTEARTPASAETTPDPFGIYRGQGEDALRATLDALDLATLRAIVRTHRLDPARISARWSARDRVINLIIEQVRARYNHGRAFERI